MKRTCFGVWSKVAVIGAIAMGGFACRRSAEQGSGPMSSDTVRAGTAVDAMLMQGLESGVSKEGDDVSLVVAHDVVGVSGRVAIQAGTPLKGRVVWSRRENVLGGLTNQPARLHIRFLETTAGDGTTVPLVSEPDLKPDGSCELNRANTGRIDIVPKLEAMLKDPQNKQSAEALTGLLRDGRLDDSATTPEGMEKLGSLCDSMGLKETAVMLRGHQASQAQDLVRQIQAGSMLSAAATGGGSLGLGAIAELAGAVGEVGSRFGQSLKGRNIKAYAGTPVTAYVAKDTPFVVR